MKSKIKDRRLEIRVPGIVDFTAAEERNVEDRRWSTKAEFQRLEMDVQTWIHEVNPKLVSLSTYVRGGYAKKEMKFMITDEFEVMPFSSFRSIQTVKKCKIAFNDLEEKDIKIGSYESLNLLKACLASQGPLSDAFGVLDTWQKM